MTPPLFDHQRRAVDFLLRNDGTGALFHEVGCGKTRTVLAAYDEMRGKVPGLRLFVVCPASLIEAGWGEDIKRFTRLGYWNLQTGRLYNGVSRFHFKARGEFSVTEQSYVPDVVIANYEHLIQDRRRPEIVEMLRAHPFMCAVDESSRMKNHAAKTTKVLISMRDLFRCRVIMSGTPAPNSDMEFWAQLVFLREGIFNRNFFAFRNYYFHLQRGAQIVNRAVLDKVAMREMFKNGFKYEITAEKRADMLSRIRPVCDFVNKDDCLDLPEQIDEFRSVAMGREQERIYRQMKTQYVAQLTETKTGDPVDFSNLAMANIILTKIMKLRQITSGFFISETDHARDIPDARKLSDLTELLEDLGDRQVIIWGQFRHEIEKIAAHLGPDRAWKLYGGMTPKARDEVIAGFKAGEAQYLIAHPASAGLGLTFTNASVSVFYSIDFSYERYVQARGRTHRPGQKEKCVYIHLICPGTVDEDALKIIQKKATAAEIAEQYLKGARR